MNAAGASTAGQRSGGAASARPIGFGLWSGIGLGVANMVGVGVLTSNGYMAKALSPSAIMLIWLLQGCLALAGARTYAALALMWPTSGGEYRYLSALLHPALGAFAGWTSLVVGFAAPVAANAFAASAFLSTLFPGLPVLATAAGLVVVFTASSLGGLGLAKGAQDVLAGVKLLLLGAFVFVGLTKGHTSWPRAVAEQLGAGGANVSGAGAGAFVLNLFFAAYAYSGWNAAAYVAGAFRTPRTTVPRAMGLAALIVTAFYLAMAYVFICNLNQSDLGRWHETRVTVAHLLVEKLMGPAAAQAASVGIVVILVSCISAMMLAGPRVATVMARDGFLPQALAGTDLHPPRAAVLLQGGLALILLVTSSFERLMAGVGIALTVSSALCALALLRAARQPAAGQLPAVPRPPLNARVAATLYLLAASGEIVMAVWLFPRTLLWLAGLALLAAFGYHRQSRAFIAARAASSPAEPNQPATATAAAPLSPP